MYFRVLFVLIILVVNIFLLDVFFWLYVCCWRGGPFWGDLLFVQIICHHLNTKLPIFKISVTDSFFLSFRLWISPSPRSSASPRWLKRKKKKDAHKQENIHLKSFTSNLSQIFVRSVEKFTPNWCLSVQETRF